MSAVQGRPSASGAAAADNGLTGPPQAGAAERTLRIALPIIMLLALIGA